MVEKEENDITDLLAVIALLLISIIATVVYLCYFIDCKNINVIPLIISSIFFFVFISLNFLLVIDYFIATDFEIKQNELVTKILSNFYSYFNRINSIMTSIIFPFMINCLETGYYSTCKIILESIHSIGKPLWKLLKKMHWRIIIIIGIVLGIVVVILYYMFKDKYKLEEPSYYFDYFAMALNIFTLIKIYINVGYFMVQLFIDCKIEGCCCYNCELSIGRLCDCCFGNQILGKKLYFYSVREIIEKTEKYLNKINEANKALNETIKTFDNETNSKFHKFLLNKVKLMKNDLELYKYENIQNVNIIIGAVALHPNNLNLNFRSSSVQNNMQFNYVNTLETNQISPKTETNTLKEKKEDVKPKEEIKNTEKESEKILAEHIRKYKKATRKIKKLNKLYNDITEEFNFSYYKKDESSKSCCYKKEDIKKCFKCIKYYFLIAAFFIVIVTDILLPISLSEESKNKNENETNITELISDTIYLTENILTDNTTSVNEEDTILGYSIQVILLVLLLTFLVVAFTCSYTVIMLFSMNKRSFISGDFLSGKKINDSISLMKTVKEICGYSFPLCYCNFYFWKFISNGPLLFYENIFIPDYELVSGVGLFMIAKLVIVFFSAAIFICCGGINKISFFKNDLADFNNKINEENYNTNLDEQNFNLYIQNNKVYEMLESQK